MTEKIENLKFIIGRYDNFIESSQSKSNLYIVLNTAILGGIITLLTSNTSLGVLIIIILGITALLAVISITLTLAAINPYLKNLGNNGKSIIFFMDVAGVPYHKFKKKASRITEEKFLDDLTCQAYSLANGLKTKYYRLRYAGLTIVAEFILLFVCVIIFIIKYFTP
jgi:hypothetical protein